MDNKGDLIKGFTDASVVRGDTKGFGDAGINTGMDPGAPVSTVGHDVSRDAVNAMGSIAGATGSDPMFEKFYRDDTLSGSNSPESVGSASFSAGSDPQEEEMPSEQAVGPGAPTVTGDTDD
jgi:hypothetical protein